MAGFGGLRDHDGTLSFKPRLPSRITRLGFRLGFQGRRLEVEVSHRQARYTVLEGGAARDHTPRHRGHGRSGRTGDLSDP